MTKISSMFALLLCIFGVACSSSADTKRKDAPREMQRLAIAGDFDKALSLGESLLTGKESDSKIYFWIASIYTERAQSDLANRDKWLAAASKNLEAAERKSDQDWLNLFDTALGFEKVAVLDAHGKCDAFTQSLTLLSDIKKRIPADHFTAHGEQIPSAEVIEKIENAEARIRSEDVTGGCVPPK